MKQKGICMKRIAYITIACAFLSVSFAKAQQIRTLKDCLEEGLQNNYSLRIVHNEEQISKNNATLGNAGYLPTLDFSAGYTGNLDNINESPCYRRNYKEHRSIRSDSQCRAQSELDHL